jgi:hypothetical protein
VSDNDRDNFLPDHHFRRQRRDGTPVAPISPGGIARDEEALLQQFAEFMLKAQLVTAKAAPYSVRSVRRFLHRPATNEPQPTGSDNSKHPAPRT